MGINSLAASFGVQPMVGIGAFGFSTGVYVGMSFGGGALKQTSITTVDCRAGYVSADAYAGIGYKLSGPFVKFVNTILASFTRYRLPDHGSLMHIGPERIMHDDVEIPNHCSTPR